VAALFEETSSIAPNSRTCCLVSSVDKMPLAHHNDWFAPLGSCTRRRQPGEPRHSSWSNFLGRFAAEGCSLLGPFR
jgi:hypothetical protein